MYLLLFWMTLEGLTIINMIKFSKYANSNYLIFDKYKVDIVEDDHTSHNVFLMMSMW